MLRLGFVALADAAPLIIAKELGYFDQQGLRVELRRELGWASIRDKILYDELDAGHALGAMPLAASLGIGSPPVPCLTAFILNNHGNAITLSQRHWNNGVRDDAELAQYIRQRARNQPLTFGVVFPTSSHHFLMRSWLRSLGVDPDKEVRIVVLPPPQVFRNLAAGTIDGYCVGEPWNSLAIQRRAGWCPITSSELAPEHPEKVLMVRRDFALQNPEEHAGLVRALDEACRFCDDPHNHSEIFRILAQPHYLNCPEAALAPGFSGRFDRGNGRIDNIEGFHRFSGIRVNKPDAAKASWYLAGLRDTGLLDPATTVKPDTLQDIYNSALYNSILAHAEPPH